MNRKPKALSGFKNIKDDEFSTLAKTVLEAMMDNVFFDEPTPELKVLDDAIKDYVEKLAMARRKGNPFDTAIKNESKEKLVVIMTELAFYVNRVSDGNLPVLLSSGFQVSSHFKTIFEPAVVEGVKLMDGRQSGQIRLDFANQSNVRIYEYRYAPDKEGNDDFDWSIVYKTTSSRGNVLSPLTPGHRYYVQVRAVNTKGVGEWSEPVSMMAR